MGGQRARIATRTPGPSAAGRACFGPGNSVLGATAGDDQRASSLRDTDRGYLCLVGQGLRASSAAVYRRDVVDFLLWWGRPPQAAASGDIARYLAERATSPASHDRRLAALADFYQAGIESGDWTSDPTGGLGRARRGSWR